MDASRLPARFPRYSIFFIIIRWKLSYAESTQIAPFLRSSPTLSNFYFHAVSRGRWEAREQLSRLPRGQLFRQTELCVEMVVSEKLIGGFAFGVPRDSFLRFPFSPHFFLPILCHSTSGFSGPRARTEVERRERSERRGRKRKKGREKRRGKRGPAIFVRLLYHLRLWAGKAQLWKFN